MFKRAILFVFIFSIFIGLNYAASPLTASSVVGLVDKLKNATDFKLYTPYNSQTSYELEIKDPYPLVLNRTISKVRLHYFDKSGKTYVFGIEEHKADGYKIRRVETIIDVRNQTSTAKTIVEEFKFECKRRENQHKRNRSAICTMG